MEISKADQIALDDALVAPANRLKIGKCNLRLSSDVTSKEATLQVVYDVLKLTPFYKAFQVSADVPEIYMQEFWAYILQICPKSVIRILKEPPLRRRFSAFSKLVIGHSRRKIRRSLKSMSISCINPGDHLLLSSTNVLMVKHPTTVLRKIHPNTNKKKKADTVVFEALAHQEFEIGVHDEQAEEEVHHLPDWFQQPKRLPSPDHAWNKSVPAVHESVQPWLSNLARRQDPRESFDELTDTTFDFLTFVMNRLNTGSTPKAANILMICKKPLPLVPNSQGRHVIPFHHFINNDLKYLRGGESSRKYSTSVTKTKAADYGHIKWIEDLVPNSMWSQVIVNYDKFALWGISHWGKKQRQFYAFATTRESARDVYSKRRIIAVTKVEIVEWQNYKHLDWITVRRDDDILYKFKEGDFHRLRIQDIEDMLLLLVQGKVTNLNVEERIAFNVSLRMFTRSVVIQRRMEDLQLGVESYQKKLNLTKPNTYRSNLRRRDAYTPYSDPRGFIYENKVKKNRLMRIDELHKFSDGTLDDVQTALNDRLKGIRMEYLPQTF
ncbi:hypothetical protein Tco_0461426 [Tanacetum coccineum]